MNLVPVLLKIVTNSRIFKPHSSIKVALDFIEQITAQPNCRLVRAELNHYKIFKKLCEKHDITGKIIADAYHAALAIEHGLQWVSADTDFAIFQDDLRFKIL